MTSHEFDQISQKIRWKLLALARRFVSASRIPDSEEDIVQDSLIELWNLIQKDYPIKDHEALAMLITKRTCIDRMKKKQPISEPIVGDDPRFSTESQPVSEQDIEKTKDRLYRNLTESQRQYLTMRYDFEMTLDQIAEKSGKPKSSIKVTISNARRQMLEEIKKEL